MKKICVIDGQGGGIGSTIIKRLKDRLEDGAAGPGHPLAKTDVEIIALGTNAIATAQMLKARANKGASGSNAIVQTVKKADVIIGPVGIIMPHAMMGEVTPVMAEAVCQSDALKILLPLSQENIAIAGVTGMPLPQLVDEIIDTHLTFF